MAHSRRVSKTEWYKLGGFKNSLCYRRQAKNGVWLHYVLFD